MVEKRNNDLKTADSLVRKQLTYILLVGNVIKGKRDLNKILSVFGSLDADLEELYMHLHH